MVSMERERILARYAELLAAESTKEAFVLDGALYYRCLLYTSRCV